MALRRMGKMLVVGATGQLGRAAIHKLRARGAYVRALIRRASDVPELARLGVETVPGDLTQPDSLRKACDGVDTIVATATAAIPTRSSDTFDAVERDGYQNLIAAARSAGVRRFVFTSIPLLKAARLSPLLPYKQLTETRLMESGLDYVIFRAGIFMDVAFTMMGSQIPLEGTERATVLRPYALVQRRFASIRDNIEQKHVALIPGDGSIRHGFIAADNVASFLTSAAMSNRSGIFPIGGPESLTYRDVVHLYERVLGIKLRVKAVPAVLFRMAIPAIRPFSKPGTNLMCVNYISATEETQPDAGAAALFGVRLTTAEEFLREKAALYALRPSALRETN
jgi:uncharacterized protein YbjT (DUF2867 family)